MLIYLQTMQATMPNKGKGQEVQEVKKRLKRTRIKFKVVQATTYRNA